MTINFTIFDECSDPLAEANDTMIRLYSDDSNYQVTTGIIDFDNGNYSHNWSTVSPDKDLSPWYNITVYVEKEYYESVYIDANESFSLGLAPELQSPSIISGENWLIL